MAFGTILVVDPSAEIRAVASQIASRVASAVRTAACGAEALSILAAEPVDAVITEAWMPGLAGNELIRRIRAAAPGAAVVVMCGYLEEPLDGPVPILLKPFTAAALLDRLAHARAAKREQGLTMHARR